MNCEWIKNNGTLYLYNELPDDARHELEHHLRKCAACTAEIDALRAFHAAVSRATPVAEPSANLLASSRMRLQEALETTEQSKGWAFAFDLSRWFHQLRFSPALAGVLLMFGFLGGALTTFTVASKGKGGISVPGIAADTNQAGIEAAPIGAIRGITPNADGQTVQIEYEKRVPVSRQGSLSDPEIQQLLLFAARSNYNSGLRMDSIDLLTQHPDDQGIREALIYALRYDKNPGVRLKALESLKPYVKGDVRVRDVMLEALLRDTNAGVRTEAIRSLGTVSADTSVRETLEALAARDQNQYIRSESRRVLATLPEIH